MTEWRWPSPHECLAALVVVAFVLLSVNIFPHDSVGEKLAQAIEMLGGLMGINIAAKHLPDRVQRILRDRDDMVMKVLNDAANGSHKMGDGSER